MMPAPWLVLFGALFTVAVAYAAGDLLLRALKLELYRGEAALFAFISGSACLSLWVFLLCLAGQARKGAFLISGSAVLALAWWRGRKAPPRPPLPTLPIGWKWLFYLVFVPFSLVYLFHAMAPEVSPDGMTYHLGNVSRFVSLRGFDWEAHSMYAFISQGLEMLFVVAFSLGRHSSAALVHCAFLLTLPWLLVSYGRRFGMPGPAVLAAVLVFTSPVAGRSGSSAYNDLAVATVIYAAFYLLQVWDETRQEKILILCGLLSGFAYGIKYTAFLALPFALGFVLWRTWARRRDDARAFWLRLLRLAGPAALLAGPWMLRNWLWSGNPFAPFLNRWFPNAFFHPGLEKGYLENLRHYWNIQHGWQVPLHLSVIGYPLDSIVGPLLLLAPVALLGLRRPQGRRMLLAALVFALPAAMNTGARFLLPCLPFLGFAMGIGLSGVRGAVALLAVFEAVACWPYFAGIYCHQWTWRITRAPYQEALGLKPAWPYMVSACPDLEMKAYVDAFVPANARIFTLGGRPEAYIDRRFTGYYESAEANLIFDMTLAPVDRAKVTHRRVYHMLPARIYGVRMVQTERMESDWTVAEMRVYSKGKELPRDPAWRLSANPNGWQVQLAFDNTYVTRWSTWQTYSNPGDRLQVNFGGSELVDAVALECAGVDARLRLEALRADGRWAPMTDHPEELSTDAPIGLRRSATLEMKARGYHFIWANDDQTAADDMRQFPSYWGLTPLVSKNGSTLYRIN